MKIQPVKQNQLAKQMGKRYTANMHTEQFLQVRISLQYNITSKKCVKKMTKSFLGRLYSKKVAELKLHLI